MTTTTTTTTTTGKKTRLVKDGGTGHTAKGGKDAHDTRVAKPAQRHGVEDEDQSGADGLPGVDGGDAGQEEVQRVGEEDDEGDASGHELKGEEGRDDDAGPGTKGHVGEVRVGDEAGIELHAAAEELGRVGGDGGREGQEDQADDPAAHLEGQGQAQQADADDGVDGVEDGLGQRALALDRQEYLVALLDLLDEDGLILAQGQGQGRVLVFDAGADTTEAGSDVAVPLDAEDPPPAAVAERRPRPRRARRAVVRAAEGAVAADDGRRRQVRRHGEDAGPTRRRAGGQRARCHFGVQGLALAVAKVAADCRRTVPVPAATGPV